LYQGIRDYVMLRSVARQLAVDVSGQPGSSTTMTH